MVAFFTQLLLAIRSWFTRRARLEVENLLLRQQLIVLRRQHPKRVLLWNIDRLLMVWLYRLYPSLLDAIIIVQPETVIRWHRRGFRSGFHNFIRLSIALTVCCRRITNGVPYFSNVARSNRGGTAAVGA